MTTGRTYLTDASIQKLLAAIAPLPTETRETIEQQIQHIAATDDYDEQRTLFKSLVEWMGNLAWREENHVGKTYDLTGLRVGQYAPCRRRSKRVKVPEVRIRRCPVCGRKGEVSGTEQEGNTFHVFTVTTPLHDAPLDACRWYPGLDGQRMTERIHAPGREIDDGDNE